MESETGEYDLGNLLENGNIPGHSMLHRGIQVFSCNSNKKLAEDIVSKIGLALSPSAVGKFSDGEIFTQITETARGADVYIVQSTCHPVNDNLMELLIMIDALKRASAGNINAIIPYFGYARQDRKARARDPISAKLVANLLTCAGANRVISMDLHCGQIQGFFDIPVDNLRGKKIFLEYYSEKFRSTGFDDVVIVSPDLGSIGRNREIAGKLNVPLAIIDKRRPDANKSEIMNIIGEVSGKRVLIIDDVIDTAGTITNAANALRDEGAKEVYVAATHAVLSGKAMERIRDSFITELLLLDTIPLDSTKTDDRIKVLSVADTFAEAIMRIHYGKSVSSMFD